MRQLTPMPLGSSKEDRTVARGPTASRHSPRTTGAARFTPRAMPSWQVAMLAVTLAACAPALELPADARVSAQVRDLFRAGQVPEAMQQMVAEQIERQRQIQREGQDEETRRRAEEVDYVYRPPPALFHQSVIIDTFNPLWPSDALGLDEDGSMDATAADEDGGDYGEVRTRGAPRRSPDAAGPTASPKPAERHIREQSDRFLREQREILRAMGDPRREVAAFRRILAEREAALGPTHPDVASAMGNLGLALADAGETAAAREMLERAVAMTERVLGPTHAEVATALDRLAAFHLRQAAPAAAEPLYERALAIRTRAAGQPPRLVPATLNNLGVVAARLGHATRARGFYDRAIAGYEEAIGRVDRRVQDFGHSLVLKQDIVVAHANAGLLAWRQGETEQAIAAFRRARETHNALRWLGFDRMSEAQQLAMIGPMSEEIETLAALEHGYAPGRAEAARLSLGGILEHKGRALESLAHTMAAAVQPAATISAVRLPLPFGGNMELPVPGANADPAARQNLRAELESVRARLANLSLFSASGPDAETRRAEIERLTRRERQLLGALGDRVHSEQSAAQLGAMIDELLRETAQTAEGKTPPRLSDERIAAKALEMMPGYADSKLGMSIVAQVQRAIPAEAALVEIASYRPLDPKLDDASKRWGPRHYAAYVLRGSGDPRSVDLGEAEAIDDVVMKLRRALADPRKDTVKAAARRLDAQVMEPVRKLVGDARHILLAPEGALHLVPFGALQDEQGRYLIERYTFTYLTTGRDLLRMQARRPSRQSPVIVADPDFGARSTREFAASPTAARSIDFRNVEFEALPGTAREAQAIRNLYPDAVLLTGASATEAAIKRVSGPRVLHLASHGFFLPDQPVERRDSGPSGPRENPLLRSGLAFAGANRGASGADDGILTALELAGLDLVGTQLVTLSACETGLGDVRRGEGVFGLRRALVIAGAESQVISLWKIDDETTESLMVDFYQRLRAAAGRAEALRQAQFRLLADRKLGHPFYWAGFILSGDWRSLQGK